MLYVQTEIILSYCQSYHHICMQKSLAYSAKTGRFLQHSLQDVKNLQKIKQVLMDKKISHICFFPAIKIIYLPCHNTHMWDHKWSQWKNIIQTIINILLYRTKTRNGHFRNSLYLLNRFPLILKNREIQTTLIYLIMGRILYFTQICRNRRCINVSRPKEKGHLVTHKVISWGFTILNKWLQFQFNGIELNVLFNWFRKHGLKGATKRITLFKYLISMLPCKSSEFEAEKEMSTSVWACTSCNWSDSEKTLTNTIIIFFCLFIGGTDLNPPLYFWGSSI